MRQEVSGDKHIVVFSNLVSNVEYTFRMQAFNKRGNGPLTKPIRVQTKNGGNKMKNYSFVLLQKCLDLLKTTLVKCIGLIFQKDKQYMLILKYETVLNFDFQQLITCISVAPQPRNFSGFADEPESISLSWQHPYWGETKHNIIKYVLVYNCSLCKVNIFFGLYHFFG